MIRKIDLPHNHPLIDPRFDIDWETQPVLSRHVMHRARAATDQDAAMLTKGLIISASPGGLVLLDKNNQASQFISAAIAREKFDSRDLAKGVVYEKKPQRFREWVAQSPTTMITPNGTITLEEGDRMICPLTDPNQFSILRAFQHRQESAYADKLVENAVSR